MSDIFRESNKDNINFPSKIKFDYILLAMKITLLYVSQLNDRRQAGKTKLYASKVNMPDVRRHREEDERFST